MSLRIPRGFRLNGIHCGIKSNPERQDMALVFTDGPCSAAGVYTRNRIVAATVTLNRKRTPSRDIRAVIVNSGNANACTGERGLRDAENMARLAAAACGVREEQVLVLSTGIIGQPLDMEKISQGIEAAAKGLATDEASLIAAARGMMTTDTTHKIAARTVPIDGHSFDITGMAKGAGMIGPRMATMLAILMTDVALSAEDAQQILGRVVDDTFNCISVEGHASTNDTVLLLASGCGNGTPLTAAQQVPFEQSLRAVCTQLARAIPTDGEGATHLIEIEVQGCASKEDARCIARTIADSALVKTAIAGGDPNWGRFVSAAGYAGVDFDPSKLELTLNGTLLFRHATPVEHDSQAVSRSIRENHETKILVRLQEGDASIRFWTSDLTAEYVRINAEYRT